MNRAPSAAIRVAAALAALLLVADAEAQTSPTITAIVEAGSAGNSFNVYVSNADSVATLRSVEIRVPVGLRYVTNVVIEPSRIEDLGSNSSREVTVTFDIAPDVPDAGAQETVVFPASAAEGILDFSNLTLQLGIETEKTRLAIVPFVVGKLSEEASDMLERASLGPEIKVTGPPPDPTLHNTVAAQSVAAGTIVEVGATIELTAYPHGLVTVPPVAGLEVPEATRRVTDAGLEPQVTPLGDAPSEEKANRVDRSEPPEGKQVEPGEAVSLFAYGDYRPPTPTEPAPELPPVGNWEQPWRGEIKLTLVIVDGITMSVAEALSRYSSRAEPAPENPPTAEGGGLLSAPGAVAGETAGAIVGGVEEGIGEAMEAIVIAIFNVLERGLPVSITLVEEQGAFRVGIPGSNGFVDKANAILTQQLPLFLPDGGNLLRATKTMSDEKSGNAAFIFELKAAPDWQQLTLLVSVKASNLKQRPGPLSLELALTGALRPGHYQAAQYEADLMALIASAMPN